MGQLPTLLKDSRHRLNKKTNACPIIRTNLILPSSINAQSMVDRETFQDWGRGWGLGNERVFHTLQYQAVKNQ